MKRGHALLLLVLASTLPAAHAQTEKWPVKSVRIVVPFTPGVQEIFRADAAESVHTTPEEFARVIAREIATWSKVVKSGNIKVE